MTDFSIFELDLGHKGHSNNLKLHPIENHCPKYVNLSKMKAEFA